MMLSERNASVYLGRNKNYLRELRYYDKPHPAFELRGCVRWYSKATLDKWKESFKLPEGIYDEQSASVYLGGDLNYLSLRHTKGRSIPVFELRGKRRYYWKKDLDAWRR